MLREELQLLQEQGSLVGEVVKAMDKKKVLVKVNQNFLLEKTNKSL
jgi:26S proteasome regulatory subunit T6